MTLSCRPLDARERPRHRLGSRQNRILTTTASRPTICSTVNSLVRSVGRIHPKKVDLEWTSCGENPGDAGRASCQLERLRVRVSEYSDRLPLSRVLGA